MKGPGPFLGALFLAVAASAAPVQRNVPYGMGGGKPLLLDACVPDGPGPFPAVIIVHGGSWAGGDKADPREVGPILAPLTQAGFAWFSVNYRLSRQARYPACIEDVEAAIQFVRQHAGRFRIDPDKIALSGDSAGAHIVEMVAVRATPRHPERWISGVIAFYGPCDLVEESFRRGGPSVAVQSLFGLPPKRLDATTVRVLEEASPIAHVRPNLPPFLLLHGTADAMVDYPSSLAWKRDLDALGVPCTLITVRGGAHVMWTWDHMKPPQLGYKQQMIAWLRNVFAHPRPVTPVRPVAVAPSRVAGVWQETTGREVVRLAPDGSGASLAGPSCPIAWSFEPGEDLVHVLYAPGHGREVPFAGSPDLSQFQKNRVVAAGVRPLVGFADWRYFPAQDLMISAEGEIFRREAKIAAARPAQRRPGAAN